MARVLLVDDSGVSRALMTRWIDESGIAQVAAVAGDGLAALAALRRTEIDVVILDIEMPGLDGLSAIPRLLAARPGVRILMASSFSERGAEVTLEALRLGASDAIAKPRAGWAARGGVTFRDELLEHVRILAETPTRPAMSWRSQTSNPRLAYSRPGGVSPLPRAVVIGASTGGPNALFQLVPALPAEFTLPVVIAQHMPALFTAALARQLNERSAMSVVEACHGLRLKPGVVHIAPGGRDMEVRGDDGDIALALDDADTASCRPSVDRLMRSAVARFGGGVIGVVLSGMGQDGVDGARAIVSAGGAVFAQDQRSAIIWGMPRAVISLGLAAEVLPPVGLAAAITKIAEVGLAESR